MLDLITFAAITLQEDTTKVTGDVGSGLVYLVAAYGVVWLFIFGYLYSLNRRQDKLRRDIEAMKQEEAIRQPDASEPSQSVSNSRQILG